MYDLPVHHVDHAIAQLDDALTALTTIAFAWSGPSAECARSDIADAQREIAHLRSLANDARCACVIAEREKQVELWSLLAVGL